MDTDSVPAADSRVGDLVQNTTEAILVQQITEALTGCGVQNSQIGIISLYRQQIKQISYLLRDRKGIEILTADRSQGRDKDCIIISMVRSNDEGQVCAYFCNTVAFFLRYSKVGDLLKDWRRINVSFTRARSKLIIVGSRKTLQTTSLLEEFFRLMDNRGWILTLPENAEKHHECLCKCVPSECTPSPKRRRIDDDSDASPETTGSKLYGAAKKARRNGVSVNMLMKGRHILSDLVNDTS